MSKPCDREDFATEMLLHFTYQVAAFSSQPAMVNHAASLHYQFGRHIPTPEPGGCLGCRAEELAAELAESLEQMRRGEGDVLHPRPEESA